MEYEIAGDPMSALRWTRKSTEKIAKELGSLNIQVSPNTVGKLLKEMGFSLRVNHKKLPTSSVSPKERNEQFIYITGQRERFFYTGDMVVSVDTKKRELVGCFKNQGQAWSRQPILVKDHDFRSQAEGIAIPYGIYYVLANRGSVFIGTSYDTPNFATDCLVRWYVEEGQKRYPNATELLILADSGGSNGSRSRIWKHGLQTKLCNPFGLTLTVCHYPLGTSKWNPIEHRLFSEISKNWAGRPLDSYETVLNYIQTTTTKSGLEVRAYLHETEYKKGVKITNEQMNALALKPHTIQHKQNYTLRPQQIQVLDQCEDNCQRTRNGDSNSLFTQNRELIFA